MSFAATLTNSLSHPVYPVDPGNINGIILPMSDDHPSIPLTDIESVLPILNKISLFGGLTDSQLYNVFQKLESVSYKANERVFEEGDNPSHIYIIQSGRVKITLDAEGSDLELVEYGVGECFGETSVIGIIPHSASAVAVEDCSLIILSGKALHAFYMEDPSLFGILILNIAREACRRLHKADEILLQYTSTNI